LNLQVNGLDHEVPREPRTTVLEVLRNDLRLTGAKEVCDMGDCGACTVLLDGVATYSCLLLAVDCDDQEIETIENLEQGSELHPLQTSFIECDALQCGFCTPGQIMSLIALFRTDAAPSDQDIVDAVSGNLCRCGAYPNIVRAAQAYRERICAGERHD
jgi:aerobic-type carbon monoxide dehydrogenase small subunit (CoxS/CutS family)